MARKYTTVLGINSGHDAGAALVRNGKVVAAINEERIRNIKHYGGIPEKSIEEVFQISSILPSEVDAIGIAGLAVVDSPALPFGVPYYLQLYLDHNPITSNTNGSRCFASYLHRFRKIDSIKEVLTKLGIPQNEIIFVEHHLAHAATAYYLSPWDLNEEVLVLTADAAGDGLSSTVSVAHKGQIERIQGSETSYYDSLGYCFYSEITAYLGMQPGDHEYKVMGLAPYGKAEYCIDKIRQMIDIDPFNPLKFKNQMGAFMPSIQKKLRTLLAGQRFDNIAAAAQLWFEKLMTDWVKHAVKATGIRRIACAGGDFLNVKANKIITALDEVDDAFFCPAAGDEGIAVGVALQVYFEMTIIDGVRPLKVPLKDIYFGTSFTNDEIKETLKRHGLLEKAELVENIDEEVGELIAKPDTIIARFKGGMEWGPRGLGNRSIIANPSDPRIIRKINYAIKMRDFWMPFAPSILIDRIHDYLVDAKPAPYMIMVFDTTEKRTDLSAAIHPYDFTCRPQTVDSEYNPEYERVLKTFESKTGIGAILNTSFNLHGYPIVYNPDIAISTFKCSALDAMAIGNYLIKK